LGRALNLPDGLMPAVQRERLVCDVEDRTDAVFDDGLFQLGRVYFNLLVSARRDHADFKLCHLTDLLFERHLRQQLICFARRRNVRRGSAKLSAEDRVAVRYLYGCRISGMCVPLLCDARRKGQYGVQK
jgi:hypothetical protein